MLKKKDAIDYDIKIEYGYTFMVFSESWKAEGHGRSKKKIKSSCERQNKKTWIKQREMETKQRTEVVTCRQDMCEA